MRATLDSRLRLTLPGGGVLVFSGAGDGGGLLFDETEEPESFDVVIDLFGLPLLRLRSKGSLGDLVFSVGVGIGLLTGVLFAFVFTVEVTWLVAATEWSSLVSPDPDRARNTRRRPADAGRGLTGDA